MDKVKARLETEAASAPRAGGGLTMLAGRETRLCLSVSRDSGCNAVTNRKRSRLARADDVVRAQESPGTPPLARLIPDTPGGTMLDR